MSDSPNASSATSLTQSDLPLSLLHRGKVREVYEVDDERLLMVASDRVSAFDVVMSEPIPDKGRVLTMLTCWWLERLSAAPPHHLLSAHPEVLEAEIPALTHVPRHHWAGRSMLVRRTDPILVECVVRGYLSGSAWREYRDHGTLAGEPLPAGLSESSPLDPPLFSPATKAQEGHDENIPVDEVARLLGSDTAAEVEGRARALYGEGRDLASARGIILADTKFEFGVASDGSILLIDEVLTPDSSRYWPKEHYAVGRGQPSLDKQPVRDYLDGITDWPKQPPPPRLTDAVVQSTTQRYRDVFLRLTGMDLDDYSPARGAGR